MTTVNTNSDVNSIRTLRSRPSSRPAGIEAAIFEKPGPRGRRRIAIASALCVVVFAALAALALLAFARHGQLSARKWEPYTQWPIQHYLLTGVVGTLEITAVSGAIALPIGVLLALGRISRSRIPRWPAALYVEVFRALPLLLLVYAFLLGLPELGVGMPQFWQLVWPIVLTNAAVLAEIFRAGLRAVPKGQDEAAAALGLRYGPTMRLIILPQALRQVAPALVGQVIRLLKDSTLGYVVSYFELLTAGKVLGEYDGTVLQSFLVVAAIYILINNLLAMAATRLERRTAV